MSEIEFNREDMEAQAQARAQEYYNHLVKKTDYLASLFFIPLGQPFRTELPHEQVRHLVCAVPLLICERRYACGCYRLN